MIKKTFVKSKACYKVTFSLPKEAAANAKEVKVLGEFNNWQWESGLKMKPTKNEFTAVLELETGKDYQFRYMIDNQVWENDWNADDYIVNDYGVENSLVMCPSVEGVKVNTVKVKTAAKTATKTTVKKATVAKKAVVKKAAKATTTKAKTAAPKAKTASTLAKAAVKKVLTKKAPAAKKVATKTVSKLDAKMNAKGLQVIEGVGPKIASLMNAAGLVTFADVAKASQATLKKVLVEAGSRFKLANPSTWSEQAQLASEGKWEALEKLQGELKGGKR